MHILCWRHWQKYKREKNFVTAIYIAREKTLELVINVIKLIECCKAADTSLIVAEMLKASGVEGAEQIYGPIKDTIHFRKIPTEWEKSI